MKSQREVGRGRALSDTALAAHHEDDMGDVRNGIVRPYGSALRGGVFGRLGVLGHDF